jgi:hypothetical protein
MSIADGLINFLIWLINNSILKVLPTEISFFPLSQLTSIFDNIGGSIATTFSFISFLVPTTLLLTLVRLIIFGEVLLFGIRGVKYVMNLARGSGS